MDSIKDLRARIEARYPTQTAFAKAARSSRQLVNAKLNGRARFQRRDLVTWGDLLDIRPDEYREYFPAYFERAERMVEF